MFQISHSDQPGPGTLGCRGRLFRAVLGLAMVLTAGLAAGGAEEGGAEEGGADTYHVAAGDRLGIAITFAPSATTERQTVQSGDRLGVIPSIEMPDPKQPYRLEPGDLLNVIFKYSDLQGTSISPLNRSYWVQTDGKLRMIGIKTPIQAAGKSTDELTKDIERAYLEGKILKFPEVTVVLENRGDVHHGLLRALLQPQSDRFSSFLGTTVGNDGRLMLPLLGAVPVTGRTIEDLGKGITGQYRKLGYDRFTVYFFYDHVADQAHEQLSRLLSDRNNPFSMEVLPSGRISLPLLRSQAVAGKTIDQIGEMLTQAYRRDRGLKRVEVSVWVERRAGALAGGQ